MCVRCVYAIEFLCGAQGGEQHEGAIRRSAKGFDKINERMIQRNNHYPTPNSHVTYFLDFLWLPLYNALGLTPHSRLRKPYRMWGLNLGWMHAMQIPSLWYYCSAPTLAFLRSSLWRLKVLVYPLEVWGCAVSQENNTEREIEHFIAQQFVLEHDKKPASAATYHLLIHRTMCIDSSAASIRLSPL